MHSNLLSYLLIKPQLPSTPVHPNLPNPKKNKITLNTGKKYKISKIFPESTKNSEVFNSISSLFQNLDSGESSTIIIYGPPNSGKTKTLHGCLKDPGILNRSISQIFRSLGENFSYKFRVIQVKGEKIVDMLSDEKKMRKVEFQEKSFKLIGIKKVEVFHDFDVFELVQRVLDGIEVRQVGCKYFSLVFDLEVKEKGFGNDGKVKRAFVRFVNFKPFNFCGLGYEGTTKDEYFMASFQARVFNKVVFRIVKKKNLPNFTESGITTLLQSSFICSKVLILSCVRNVDTEDNRFTLMNAARISNG